MPYFRVPERHRPGLVVLKHVQQNRAGDLLKALAKSPRGQKEEVLAKNISQELELTANDALELVKLIFSFYRTKNYTPIELSDLVGEICDAIERTQDDSFYPSDGNWDDYKSFLTEILSFESNLGVTSKAVTNSTDHEKIYSRAKIYTDIRPIFGSNLKEGFEAASIVHILLVHYDTISGHNEIQMALDGDDLLELKKLVQRAEVKDKAIRKELGEKIDFL